jgi:hypothetical protein
MRHRRDPAPLLGDERDALPHPRVDEELARLTFEVVQHGVHRHRHAGGDGLRVGVHQRRNLVAV